MVHFILFTYLYSGKQCNNAGVITSITNITPAGRLPIVPGSARPRLPLYAGPNFTLPLSSAVCMLMCRHDARQLHVRGVPERVWNTRQTNTVNQCLQSYLDDVSRRTICHWTTWFPRSCRRYNLDTVNTEC